MSRAKGLSWGWLALWAWVLCLAYWPVCPQAALAQELLALVLREESSGKALWCSPVVAQEELVVEFLHSYDRFPVREHYRILGPGRILFHGMITRSLLNGQGFTSAEIRTRPDGWLEVDVPCVWLDRVEFIMGSKELADHRILLRGVEHRLSQVIESGASVVIQAEASRCAGSVSGS